MMTPPVKWTHGSAPVEVKAPSRTTKTSDETFSGMVNRLVRGSDEAACSPVRFSIHAARRLDERHIRLTASDLGRIERAVDQAAAKGGRESLVLMDHAPSADAAQPAAPLALVVSVPNRTVITVVPPNAARHAVFTNIDSAVVACDATAAHDAKVQP